MLPGAADAEAVPHPPSRPQIHLPRPPEHEEETAEWLAAYRRKSEPYAVCRYIETLNGSANVSDPVILFHDEATRAHSGGKLA